MNLSLHFITFAKASHSPPQPAAAENHGKGGVYHFGLLSLRLLGTVMVGGPYEVFREVGIMESDTSITLTPPI